MKNIKRLLGALLVLSLFLAGCGTDETKEENNQDDNVQETEQSPTLSSDEEVEEEISSNKNVESVSVQIDATGDDEYVNVDLVVKDDKNIEEEIEEYVDIIKEAYPEHIIDIIAIHDDHLVYQETFE